MTRLASKALFFALPLAIPAAFWSGRLQLPLQLQKSLAPALVQQDSTTVEPYSCEAHKYTTEIVSLDPLIIYINNFTSVQEAANLIKAGEADFEESVVSHQGRIQTVGGRTSSSAPLEPEHPLVSCILSRARRFMGSMLQPHEPFSIPQLVRYYPGQKYDLHTDFWMQPRLMDDGSGRKFNRVASFFVFLKANCTEGETHFPFVETLEKEGENGEGMASAFNGKLRRHEKGGIAFKPIVGSAIFWRNLDDNGKGDKKVMHAGLPVGEGEKIGMNIWPRKFY